MPEEFQYIALLGGDVVRVSRRRRLGAEMDAAPEGLATEEHGVEE